MLYLVPTPIGNLGDMTSRAIQVLKDVDCIYAEDTRTSGNLLKHFGIENTLRSFHSFNEHKIVTSIAEEIKKGKDVALISDAGTPSISDPGYLLVKACADIEASITCLPGANALIPALAMSALPSDKFYFEGFLPHKKGRQTRHKFLSTLPCTFIIYESPYRLVKCLEELKEYCGGERKACVVREISKIYEESKRGTLDDLISYYLSDGNTKGEIVIVVAGC
jgi:16S rRNA (cytidine1402-2'-O)-methyltransferase